MSKTEPTPATEGRDPVDALASLVARSSLAEVGARLGKSKSAINHWVKRRRPIDPTLVTRILDLADRSGGPVSARIRSIPAPDTSDAAPVDTLPSSAKGNIEAIIARINRYQQEADHPDIRWRDKVLLINAATAATKVLGALTGELGASESAVVQSPHFKRLVEKILTALEAHPAALKDVVQCLETEPVTSAA